MKTTLVFCDDCSELQYDRLTALPLKSCEGKNTYQFKIKKILTLCMSVNCLHPVSVVTKNMYVVQKFFDRDKHPQTRWIKSTHIGKFGKKGWQEAQKSRAE